jgi:autotransporter-associated beta strand protein
MTGGKILANQRFVLGSYGSAYATVSGGEIEALAAGRINECMEVGRDPGSFGQLIMTGGALKGTNELVIARDAGSTGLVYVAGGDLYFNAIRRANGRHALYLAGGTLHPYNGDAAFSFNGSLTNDIGYGDTGTVFGLSPVDKDGTERTVSVRGTFTGNGGLAKRDGGAVLLSGTLSYTGDTVVESGTLALSNTVASLASGVIEVQSGATLDVSLGRAAAFSITSGQALRGAGTVLGPVRLATGATLSGGSAADPEVLTIDGDLTLDADSTLLFNMLSGAYSRVHVTGNLTLPASANLIVNGAATTDAQGRAMLTWSGSLTLPSPTRWTVTGEKDPFPVINYGAKSLTLSYIKGTLLMML